jgi:predicted RNase H-like nuclease (RuvC/YqgF family)
VKTEILVAIVAGVPTIAVSVIAWVGSRQAQKATLAAAEREAERDVAADKAKVEAQAYERARISYQKIVADLEHQVERYQKTMDRLQAQVDRVMDQLAKEQDVSNTLRLRIAQMQDQIAAMQREIDASKATIAEHQRINEELQEELLKAGIRMPPVA